MGFNIDTINISEHARQRYVERVRGKDNRNDIAQFSVTNRDRIDEALRKMLGFGEEIYFGETIHSKNSKGETKKIHILISGSWFFLVSEDNALITLYKKDFGFEDEAFNKSYVKRVVKEVERLNEVATEASAKEKGEREKLQHDVNETDAAISDLRRRIKTLEQENEARKELLKLMNADAREAQNDIKDFISNIVGTRLFG
jgi:hypothetical protein